MNLTKKMLEDYARESYRGFTPEISNNPIINLLSYYKTGFDWMEQNGHEGKEFKEYEDEYNDFRLKYDADARFYNDLRADTVISFWTIYKELLKRNTGRTYEKRSKPFNELIDIEVGRDCLFFILNEKRDAFYALREFAELYHTKGNFMLLPDREMNSKRYEFSQDRIDKSLYECFPGGELAHFFGANRDEQTSNLTKWVKEQNLLFMFTDGVVCRDNIIPFNRKKPFVAYEYMTDTELEDFIKSAIDFIKRRNNLSD